VYYVLYTRSQASPRRPAGSLSEISRWKVNQIARWA